MRPCNVRMTNNLRYIHRNIYNDFLDSQLSQYPKGTVKYYGKKYTIPASVFTDKTNWQRGSFSYSWSNASKSLYNLKATGTAGHSIFWRTEKKMKYVIILITLITFSTQKVKGNECISQICDVESSIIIRTQEKEYFVVQLFRGFTKEGEFVKKLLISKNRKDIVSIVLPSSEEVKNFDANIKKYRTGFILETLYGGGENFYTRSFYFKCIKGNLFLYKIVGTHIIPNSDKKLVNTKNIRPQINVRNFNIQYYLENTP